MPWASRWSNQPARCSRVDLFAGFRWRYVERRHRGCPSGRAGRVRQRRGRRRLRPCVAGAVARRRCQQRRGAGECAGAHWRVLRPARPGRPRIEDRPFKRPFSFPMAPRTRHNRGGTQRPTRLNLSLDAVRDLSGVHSPAEKRPSGRRPRVTPCHRAESIGPENPRAQPTPAALVAGSPERSQLGSVRPLAAPGHGPAHEAVPWPAIPGA